MRRRLVLFSQITRQRVISFQLRTNQNPKNRGLDTKTRSAKNKISAYFFRLESISAYFLRNVFYLFRVRFHRRIMPLCAIVIHAHHRHRPRQNHRARGVGKFRQFRAGLCQISGQANAR